MRGGESEKGERERERDMIITNDYNEWDYQWMQYLQAQRSRNTTERVTSCRVIRKMTAWWRRRTSAPQSNHAGLLRGTGRLVVPRQRTCLSIRFVVGFSMTTICQRRSVMLLAVRERSSEAWVQGTWVNARSQGLQGKSNSYVKREDWWGYRRLVGISKYC